MIPAWRHRTRDARRRAYRGLASGRLRVGTTEFINASGKDFLPARRPGEGVHAASQSAREGDCL
jgi:hypothetical protein